MDVAAWLRDLGLERYAPAFRDAEITPEALPELTDADLRELGLPLGPRKVVLKAIQALAGPPTPSVGVQAEPRPGARRPRPSQAERRQLTVMFVDLVGSTALSAGSTPRRCARSSAPTRTPSRARSPASRARRQVHGRRRAGLLRLAPGARGRRRAGGPGRARRSPRPCRLVHAGRRAARRPGRDRDRPGRGRRPGRRGGGARGGRRRRDAEPGRPAAGAGRARQRGHRRAHAPAPVGGLFELERPRRRRALKGFAEPVRAWRVRRRAPGRGPLRGAARRPGSRRWSAASRSWPCCSTAGSAPRRARARSCCSRASPASASRASSWRCASGCGPSRTRACATTARPTTRNSALHPVIEQLERGGRLRPRTTPRTQARQAGGAARAQAVTTRRGRAAPRRPARRSRRQARYPPLDARPRSRGRRGPSRRCCGQLEGLAARRPVLLVLEDAHWGDPTTLELFDRVVERVQRLPVLLRRHLPARVRAALDRPRARHRAHPEPPRAGRQAAAMVERVAGGKALPAEVLDADRRARPTGCRCSSRS